MLKTQGSSPNLSRDGTTGTVEVGAASLCTKPQNSTVAHSSQPCTPTLLHWPQNDIHKSVHYNTQQGIHFMSLPQTREGYQGFQMLQQWCLPTSSQSGSIVKSLVTVFPPTWCVTLFNISSTSEVSQNQGSSTT